MVIQFDQAKIIIIIILLHKIEWFIDFSAIKKTANLTCVIIHGTSHVSIIMKCITVYCSIFVGQ